jgi:RNA polymerase sigma-70 factor (ECF subfamily)
MTEKEFADIVGSTKKIVLSAIEKHLSARFYHAIDDIAQESYLRAYRSIIKNKFRGDSKIETWLYAIARNEALRMNDRLTREEEKFKKSVLYAERTTGTDDRDPEDAEHLYRAIDKLPGTYRNVMELVAKGFTMKQIAAKLEIEVGTVKSRTSRGKEALQKILVENGHEQ